MKSLYRHLLFLLIITAVLVTASPAAAQNPTPVVSDDEVNAVAQDLFCPVCENIPLDVCPTKACAQWRELIREKIALGWSEAEIKKFFAEQYGEQVLAVPSRKGLNWAVYIIPPLVLIGGILVTINIVKKSHRSADPAATKAEVISPSTAENLLDKIEKDIQKEE